MSRIPLIEENQAPLPVRPFFAKGDPGPIVASIAHVPELLRATAPFLGAAFGASAVPMRLKEIIVLRVSARMRCRYCVETHTAVALDVGLSREEVVALREPGSAAATFPHAGERALLAWVEAFADGPAPIPETLASELRQHYSEAEVVEMTLLAGATIMLNRYCTALDLPTSAATLEKLEAAGL